MPHKPNQADTPNTITHCIMHDNSRLPVVPPVTTIALIRHDACRCQSAASCPAAPCRCCVARCHCHTTMWCRPSPLLCCLLPCCPLPSSCRPLLCRLLPVAIVLPPVTVVMPPVALLPLAVVVPPVAVVVSRHPTNRLLCSLAANWRNWTSKPRHSGVAHDV